MRGERSGARRVRVGERMRVDEVRSEKRCLSVRFRASVERRVQLESQKLRYVHSRPTPFRFRLSLTRQLGT